MATGGGSGHHPREGDLSMSSEERQLGAAPSVFDDMYPYRGRFETHATLPLTGRDRGEILDDLRRIARGEDARWETGRISGSYYHGGKDHYAFLNEIFGLFSHVNLLQRDMCPSGTKFEAEIVSMTANMLHAEAVECSAPDDGVCGAITSGGSDSIMLPMLAFPAQARAARGITAPEMVVPDTIHPAFEKGAYYFGLRLLRVPVGAGFLPAAHAMPPAAPPA